MAYANARAPRNRLPVLVTVAAIHVAAGYALVTGLAATIIKVPVDIFEARNIPTKPLPPTPDATPSEKADLRPLTIPDQVIVLPTDNLIRIDPMILPPLHPTTIAEVEFPVVPPITPSATPSFAPKGAVARGNPGLWVTVNDYPTDEIRREHQGVTRFRLSIGSDGRVTECAVTGSSGWPGLDRAACARLAQRARFTPATDESGAKVAGSYASSVRWEIPD